MGLWALTATHAANDFYTGAVAALLPFFVLHAQYSYAAVAGITLAATALSSVAQPMFGFLSDRFGMRWMSLAGLLAAGAGIALSGIVADSYAAVWAVVAISGIGVAAYHPAATMEARELGGGTSGSMSLFSVGGNVGVALAPSAVILVVGLFGLSGSALLIIPAVVLGAVYAVVSRRHLFSRAAPVERAAAAPKASIPDDWRAFTWLTAVLATWSVAYVGTSTFISLYSIQKFDVGAGFASIALSVFPAAGAVGTLTGGWLSDRLGRLRVVRAGYLLAAAATVAIAFAPTPAAVIAATAALGTGLFLPFAAQITLSHSYLPNRIGMASGVTLGLTLSLGGLVSPLLGSIADRASIQSVFMIVAALLMAGFALSFVLKERRPGSPQIPEPQIQATELDRIHE
ncbi:FSR family fosmidomycin resistance protein-like MFS transporter [Arthrobacter stackebrandtii]|uniref:FSR family fosmidomycin resistance protein-like MFS transporter n=1 Tax=Arthrobacter stackebrandtii TaxID=272161 RepID=A0ABS4YZ81_9MICC|nr:MFS transporter [Arthrobacter stackebrandtii]MBP2414101.1 FSR family fosmidomycin resistance protein-like MFS transporter [Arthrobacter stackebrandtii]